MKIWIFLMMMVLSIYPADSAAQATYTIQGEISVAGQTPEFVEVYLLDANREKILTYQQVENAHFSFSEVLGGQYVIKISALGYLDHFEEIGVREDVKLTIELQADKELELEEVEIVASKKIYSNDGGNLKINIENSALSSVSNSLDVLSKLPGVQIAPNRESVSVMGKGTPLIYLGNQRISLDQFNLIPVQDLKDIELIQNPSAKYEAEGRAVLLVRLKTRKKEGYNMAFTESIGKKDGFNNYLAWNANFNQKKWSWKTNLGYNQLEPLEQVLSSFQVLGRELASDYVITVRSKRPVYLLGGGGQYEFKEDNYLSFHVNTEFRSDVSVFNTNSNLFEGPVQTKVKTYMDSDDARELVNATVNYQKKWKSNQLFVGGQYVTYHKKVSHEIQNNINENGYEYIQDQLQDFGVDVYAGRLDYERNFGKNVSWESGLNLSTSRAETLFEIQDKIEQTNSSQSSYKFEEHNHAAYSQVSGKIKEVRFSAGVRVEKVIAKGRFEGAINELIDRNNTFLFPKVMLHIPVDSNQNLTMNYGRSISRPKFSDLSQISVYVNPFSIISGNSNLKSTLSQEISATYQYKDKSLSISYTDTHNPVFYYTLYDEERALYILTPQNIASSSSLSLNLSVPLSHKLWSSLSYISLISSSIKDDLGLEQGSAPYLYIYSNQELKLPNSFSVSVSGWGMTRRKEGIFQRNALFILNLSFSKTFFEKVQASLAFNDIFHGMRYEDRSIIGPLESTSIFNADSREVALSLRYTIGSGKSRYKNKKVFEDENRVK